MSDLFFGPSGHGETFEQAGVSSDKIPVLLREKNLDCYEHSFTRGARIGNDKALAIKNACEENNILLSVHAPYYINLANKDPEMIVKSFGYFEECLVKMKIMGANRLIFHPGSLQGDSREAAAARVKNNLKLLLDDLKQKNLLWDGLELCPETMGKHGQVGTPKEVADFCTVDPIFVPCIDFGHVNAFYQGALKTKNDFVDVLKVFEEKIGERAKSIHIHFSKIEYGSKGEIRHLNFSDEGEPDFRNMIEALDECGVNARIISESSGHQVEDSCEMKKYWQTCKKF